MGLKNKLIEIENCDCSVFLFGSDDYRVRRNLSNNDFLFEIDKFFNFNGRIDFQKYTLENLHEKSIYKNETFSKFLFEFAKLTTKQMSFFVYSNFIDPKNINLYKKVAYNKKPNKPKWFEVEDETILLYEPNKHLKFLNAYIGKLLNYSNYKFNTTENS